ncbi:hypothetical protein [Mycobacterium sp.]|uniref:hypothetical protein n=1 Tax=Mycobacterium sp. TaxID=1785 RepID=UPI003A86444A
MASGLAQEPERGLWLGPQRLDLHRADLTTFVEHALRLDDSAVIRIRAGSAGLVRVWAATGFDVLAGRVVAGRVRPGDLSVAADGLARGLAVADDSGYVDPGFAMDSAWRGGLPPESGFEHLDDVPARVIRELAQRGAQLVREHSGSHGPPASLLDQEIVEVRSGDIAAGLPMRCVFALTAMGFLPSGREPIDDGECVRVRVSAGWLRLDARFGSVYRHRGHAALLLG